MPQNKQYMDRLVAIHEKLSSGQHYTFEELREACERKIEKPVSDKTLYNDLKALRDLDAPIPERDRSGRPYYYTSPFSLYGVLNPTDAALANEAVALLRQMQTLPQFDGLEEIMLKFEQQPGVIGKPQQPVVQFEQNEQYTGLRWLTPLYQAIQSDNRVLIGYRDFKDQAFTFEVSPYLLKEYNNRWFIFGWVESQTTIYNLALDRIQTITPLPTLRRPDITDWITEFADVVGATRSLELLETVVLRVLLPRARYVETKPLHRSQTLLNQTDTCIDFQYQLRWNLELEARILELGADAELLTPETRRKRLADVVQKLMKRYESRDI